ncbi:MAG TPA: alkaline phosphatase family protein [Thermoplasmata archaeon]|nr:alkaline phosphatase family protein [Thermoplasmata archaeon]
MGARAPDGANSDFRAVLVVLDGLGDRPHPETGNLSPVEAAATPHLDGLAARGTMGAVTVVAPGVAPESDAGVLALLGYDPVTDSPGRGVLEAMGVEIPLAPGDVAFRLNFATIDGTGAVLDARVGRSLSTSESRTLAATLTAQEFAAGESVHAEVRPTVGHRGVLWLHPTDGIALSPNVSNSDPFYERIGGLGSARRPDSPHVEPIRPLDGTDAAARTARAANAVSDGAARRLPGEAVNARRAMAGRPIASGLLLRNAGGPKPPGDPIPFAQRHGRAGAAVTEMPVERGIARLLGLEDRYVGPMGPDRVAGYRDRARATREALSASPFVYVHLKGPDEPGHDGRANDKRAVLESIDRDFFGPFLDGLDLGRVRIAVTADHATPCILKGHSDDPVPLLLAGRAVPADGPGPRKFCERSAAAGRLGALRGRDVLVRLFEERPAGA